MNRRTAFKAAVAGVLGLLGVRVAKPRWKHCESTRDWGAVRRYMMAQKLSTTPLAQDPEVAAWLYDQSNRES